jgi:hypothetical protein
MARFDDYDPGPTVVPGRPTETVANLWDRIAYLTVLLGQGDEIVRSAPFGPYVRWRTGRAGPDGVDDGATVLAWQADRDAWSAKAAAAQQLLAPGV